VSKQYIPVLVGEIFKAVDSFEKLQEKLASDPHPHKKVFLVIGDDNSLNFEYMNVPK